MRKRKLVALLGIMTVLVSGLIYISFNPWFFYQFRGHTDIGISVAFTDGWVYYTDYLSDEGCSMQLGDYKNTKYGIYSYELSDETVEAYAIQSLLTYRRIEYIYDRPAEYGDIINGSLDVSLSDGRSFHVEDEYIQTEYEDGSITAIHTRDGVLTTDSTNLTGGALETACIGHNIGDSVTATVDVSSEGDDVYDYLWLCRLTDEYRQGLLNGLVAEVSVTIKSIAHKYDVEEFDEEFFEHMYAISGLSGPSNYEDYIAFTRSHLEDSSEYNLRKDNEKSLLMAIIQDCSFNIADGALAKYENENELFRSNMEYILKRQLLIKAIAEAEGIEVSGSEYRAAVRKAYYNLSEDAKYVCPTLSSVVKKYGKEEIKWQLLQEKVLNYLRDTLEAYDAGTNDYVSDYLK